MPVRLPCTRLMASGSSDGGTKTVAVDKVAIKQMARSLEDKYSAFLRLSDVKVLEQQVAELEAVTSGDGFWDDPSQASKQLQDLNTFKASLSRISEVRTMWGDVEALMELAEDDPGSERDLLIEAAATLDELQRVLDEWELTKVSMPLHQQAHASKERGGREGEIERGGDGGRSHGTRAHTQRIQMLDGPYDAYGCVLSIQSGAGGVDAMDWADMLLRMYTRWAAKKDYKCTVVDVQDGEEAGGSLHGRGPGAVV